MFGPSSAFVLELVFPSAMSITPRHVFQAAARWDVRVVELALDGGFPVDAADKFRNDTLLHCVVASSNPSMHVLVPRMLAAGWDPNAANTYGSTPLLYACIAGCVDTVRAMVLAGGTLAAVDVDGWTALDYAARTTNPHAWQVLEWLATRPEVDWWRKPPKHHHALHAIEGTPLEPSIKARFRAVIEGAMAAQRRWTPLRAAFVGAAAAAWSV